MRKHLTVVGFVLAPYGSWILDLGSLAGTPNLLSISLVMGPQSSSSLASNGQSTIPLQRNPSAMHGPFSQRNVVEGQMMRSPVVGLLVAVTVAVVVVVVLLVVVVGMVVVVVDVVAVAVLDTRPPAVCE